MLRSPSYTHFLLIIQNLHLLIFSKSSLTSIISIKLHFITLPHQTTTLNKAQESFFHCHIICINLLLYYLYTTTHCFHQHEEKIRGRRKESRPSILQHIQYVITLAENDTGYMNKRIHLKVLQFTTQQKRSIYLRTSVVCVCGVNSEGFSLRFLSPRLHTIA